MELFCFDICDIDYEDFILYLFPCVVIGLFILGVICDRYKEWRGSYGRYK